MNRRRSQVALFAHVRDVPDLQLLRGRKNSSSMPISFRGDVPRQGETYAEQAPVLARRGELRVAPPGVALPTSPTAAIDVHGVQVDDHVGHRRKFWRLRDEVLAFVA